MSTYTSKAGQKSKRAKWKDRQERAYYATLPQHWHREGATLAGLQERAARGMNRRITPRTGALLAEWRELSGAAASLLEVMRQQDKVRNFGRYGGMSESKLVAWTRPGSLLATGRPRHDGTEHVNRPRSPRITG